MKYSIDPWIFEKNPNVCFGVIIGKNLSNTETSKSDSSELAESEIYVKKLFAANNLKTHPAIALYRDALKNVGINPNKFTNSVEAMSKRVIKSNSLPRINALVDLCNAFSLRESISLGAHDLSEINYDLEVRLSHEGDKFMPFGTSTFEIVPKGELVFVSGNEVQTRQWLWRQSEHGKITLDSKNILFQLVGFMGENKDSFNKTMNAIEKTITKRFKGTYKSFVVDKENPEIYFDK